MRSLRLVLLAALLVVPFTMKANAQVAVGVGIGPAVVAAPIAYGPPACEWGYYSYYPYACAPYGYYGPDWFAGGVFIGVGPWYGWGRHGWGGYGYRGGYGFRGGYGYRGGYGGVRGGVAGGYRGGAVGRGGFAGGARGGFSGGGHAGFSGGGGFHGGGGGGSHGGGGHR